MKNLLTTILTFVLFLGLSQTLEAQKLPMLDNSPLDISYFPPRAAFRGFENTEQAKAANEPVIRVLYSRPQKKGRDIFGDLVEYDKMWRAGANESTEIMFFKDVTINGTKVEAGRYTIHVMPTADNWTVFFNSDLDGWGSYHYNEDNNVASITVPTQLTLSTVENFGIFFEEVEDGAHMIMAWDDTVVRVPIQF